MQCEESIMLATDAGLLHVLRRVAVVCCSVESPLCWLPMPVCCSMLQCVAIDAGLLHVLQ